MLKFVQRMTIPIHVLRNFPHNDRLRRLNLHSVERRRVRGALTEALELMKCFNKDYGNKVLVVGARSRDSQVFKQKH